jgi:hypothetical protein
MDNRVGGGGMAATYCIDCLVVLFLLSGWVLYPIRISCEPRYVAVLSTTLVSTQMFSTGSTLRDSGQPPLSMPRSAPLSSNSVPYHLNHLRAQVPICYRYSLVSQQLPDTFTWNLGPPMYASNAP